MIFSFIIGMVLRLLNVLFQSVPALGDITAGFGTALTFFVTSAMPWDFIFPITDSLVLVQRVLYFEFAILLLWFGKYVIELIRGK